MEAVKFGSLQVLHKATNTRGDGRNVGNKRSKVLCDCGSVTSVRTSWLERGKVTKCWRCERQKPSL